MIVPNRKYTKEQLDQLILNDPSLKDLQMKGYVLRAEGGLFSFVHWTQASGNPKKIGKMRDRKRVYQGSADWGEIDPIRKRTPQERMASLLSKVGEDLKYLHRTDTGEEVRVEAQTKIEDADRKNESVLRPDIRS